MRIILIIILGLLLAGCADLSIYDAQLAEKDATIANLQNELLSRDALIADKDEQIAQVKVEYEALKAEKEPKPLKNFSSTGELARFLWDDDTDTFPYTSDFDCDDFAYRLCQNGLKQGYHIGLYSVEGSIRHLKCFAIVETDKNYAYSIEPQTDSMVFVGVLD